MFFIFGSSEYLQLLATVAQGARLKQLHGLNMQEWYHFIFCLQLLELIAKSQLTSLSGIAQKNYMNILERVVQKGEHLLSFFWPLAFIYST